MFHQFMCLTSKFHESLSQSNNIMKPNHFLFRMKSSSQIKQPFMGTTSVRSTSHVQSNDPWRNITKKQSIKREIKMYKKSNRSQQKINSVKESLNKRNLESLSSFEKINQADISTTNINQVKRHMIFSKSNESESDGIREIKKFLQSTKKIKQRSKKNTGCKEAKTVFIKDIQNNPNRHNTIVTDQPTKSHRLTYNQPFIQSYKDISQQKILTKKDFMKIFIHKNKTKEEIPSSSQHLIEVNHNRHECLQKTQTILKQPHHHSNMFTTNNGFIKNKQSTTSFPYLQLNNTNKLKKYKKSQPKVIKKIDEQSQKSVSIELTEEILNQESENFPSLSESSINYKQERNDSSFLGESDKKILETFIFQNKAINIKRSIQLKKHRKMLPNDFMK